VAAGQIRLRPLSTCVTAGMLAVQLQDPDLWDGSTNHESYGEMRNDSGMEAHGHSRLKTVEIGLR
ncbi:unnamed protein product, partial [Closterium sp. NIES-64]